MPLTRFPNGLTVNSTTALVYSSSATDGDIDTNRLFVAGVTSINTLVATSGTFVNLTASGTVTVATTGRFTIGTGTGPTMIGERIYYPISFTSAAVTTYQVIPVAGNIIDCWVTCDTTPRTCSAFTLYANGTGGTVVVASVALAYATAIGQQIQPTLTPAIQGTGTALAFVVTTAGTAANFSAVVVIQRTV